MLNLDMVNPYFVDESIPETVMFLTNTYFDDPGKVERIENWFSRDHNSSS